MRRDLKTDRPNEPRENIVTPKQIVIPSEVRNLQS
jgi:hypothetical protein